jgi:hypothetical protein
VAYVVASGNVDQRLIAFIAARDGFATLVRRQLGRVTEQHATAVLTVKSYPAILMVQSAQNRAADDIPGPLNAARKRGILVQ